ncbi:hypothetical protein D3C78_1108850 [compost metagenome]
MHAGHDLHQALGADRALGKGIEARLDGHDGQNQGGVDLVALAQRIGFGDQRRQRLGRDAVFLAEPVGHRGLLVGQLLGVGGGGTLDGVGFGGHVDHGSQGDLARLQPIAQLGFAGVAQVGAGEQRDGHKGHGQTQQGEAAMGDGEKTVGHIGCKGAHSGECFCGCRHIDSFQEAPPRWCRPVEGAMHEGGHLDWRAAIPEMGAG